MSSEKTVAEFLEGKNFTVSVGDSENSNGIDIVAIKNGKHFLVEVKKCCKSTRSYVVTKLGKSGLSCTHVAMVTPKRNIIFSTVKDHLRLCNKDGTRMVTNLVELYDEF